MIVTPLLCHSPQSVFIDHTFIGLSLCTGFGGCLSCLTSRLRRKIKQQLIKNMQLLPRKELTCDNAVSLEVSTFTMGIFVGGALFLRALPTTFLLLSVALTALLGAAGKGESFRGFLFFLGLPGPLLTFYTHTHTHTPTHTHTHTQTHTHTHTHEHTHTYTIREIY